MLHTEGGLQRVLVLLSQDLTHLGVGNSSTPPAASELKLRSETFRKAKSESLIDGQTLVSEIYMDESEGNGSITEYGIFGSGATAAKDSGKTFASFGTVPITKDSTQSLTVTVEIDVVEMP